MNPEHLRKAGEILFGLDWMRDFPHELRISDHIFRRMAAGEREIPPTVVAEIIEMLRTDKAELDALIEEIAIHQSTEKLLRLKSWEGIILRAIKTADGGLSAEAWHPTARAWQPTDRFDKIMSCPDATIAELEAVGLSPDLVAPSKWPAA